MTRPPFDPDHVRREYQRRNPLQDLDHMRSSAAYTHGSAYGGLAYFFATLAVAVARLVVVVVMLPVRLVRRRHDEGAQ